MTDIPGLISSLQPEDLAVLQERGPGQLLDRDMLDAIDRAAAAPVKAEATTSFAAACNRWNDASTTSATTSSTHCSPPQHWMKPAAGIADRHRVKG